MSLHDTVLVWLWHVQFHLFIFSTWRLYFNFTYLYWKKKSKFNCTFCWCLQSQRVSVKKSQLKARPAAGECITATMSTIYETKPTCYWSLESCETRVVARCSFLMISLQKKCLNSTLYHRGNYTNTKMYYDIEVIWWNYNFDSLTWTRLPKIKLNLKTERLSTTQWETFCLAPLRLWLKSLCCFFSRFHEGRSLFSGLRCSAKYPAEWRSEGWKFDGCNAWTVRLSLRQKHLDV